MSPERRRNRLSAGMGSLLLLLLFLFTIFIPAQADGERAPAQLVLLFGQSNMNGLGSLKEMPEEFRAKPPENVFIWKAEKKGKGGRFVPLESQGFNAAKHFGPEMGFGFDTAKAAPETTFYLVKFAASGTNLHKQWHPKGKDLYPKALARALEAMVAAKKADRTVRIGGILWMQGESDAMQKEMADAYEKNLRLLIGSLRRDLKSPKVPFIIGRITSALKKTKSFGGFPHTDRVRQAQDTVAESMENVRIFSTDEMGMNGDNVHYNAAGQAALGRAFAKSYLGEEEAGEESGGDKK